jgi:hypothetical protein
MTWTKELILRKYPDLVADIKSEEVVFFIGAGFSKFVGLPLWDELISPFKARVSVTTTDPILVAETFVKENTQGRFLLNKHIKKELTLDKIVIPRAHKILFSLPLRTILTLNFDEVIEETLKTHRRCSFHKIVHDRDIPYSKTKSITLYKVNGCITDIESIIITESDFIDYKRKRKQISDDLKHLLGSQTFFYIGSSFRDPIFAQFNRQVIQRLGKHKRPSYLVSLNSDSAEIVALQKQGIEVIDLKITDLKDAESIVTSFLESLYQAVMDKDFIDDNTLLENFLYLLNSRMGTGLSLQVNPKHIDTKHRYKNLFRQDLLDYPTGDFYSIRKIKGINVSGEESHYLIYSESSEKKITFKDTEVLAYDCKRKKPLRVEPFEDENLKLFTHAFKIHFEKPVKPNEEFEIVYKIRLPGELNELSSTNEIMSVSLARVVHGVENLEFNVCLNYKPKSFYSAVLDNNTNKYVFTDELPLLEKYRPQKWYEKLFEIKWSDQPWRITWKCKKPQDKLYIINYIKD